MQPTDATLAIARDFRDRLAAASMPAELRLFGPRRRGDDTADLDLCVIFAEPPAAEQLEQVYALAWSTGFDHGVTLCPLVLCRRELEEHASPLVAAIRDAGLTV